MTLETARTARIAAAYVAAFVLLSTLAYYLVAGHSDRLWAAVLPALS